MKNPANKKLAAWAVFAVFCAAIWRRMLFLGEIPANGNLLSLGYPDWLNLKHALLNGQLPLWQPLKNMGEPFLADPQSLCLYPPMWLGVLFDFHGFMAYWVLLHAALAFHFSRKLFSLATEDYCAAAAGAAIIALGPLFISKTVFPNYLAALAWIPAALYFYLRKDGPAFSLSLALLWLSGFPPYCVLAGTALPLLSAWRRDLKFLLKWALPAAGLAAAQLLPFLEMLSQSDRGLFLSGDKALLFSIEPGYLLRQLLLPFAYLKPPACWEPSVYGFYIGPAATGLALFAAVKGPKRNRPLIASAAVFLALSLGKYNPLYSHIPGITVFRFPGHWLVPASFCLAALAVSGISLLRGNALKYAACAVMLADLFAASLFWRGFASVTPDFFSNPPALARYMTERFPNRRIFHAKQLLDALNAQELAMANDYLRLRDALYPPYGTAFGIPEARSYQVLVPAKAARFAERLDAARDTKLFNAAAIGIMMDLVADGKAGRIVSSETGAPHGIFYCDGNCALSRIAATNSSASAEIIAESQSFAVLAETHFPGWRAYLDGRKVPITEIDGIFMAAEVPPGKHAVLFKYRPAVFFIGVIIAILSALLLISAKIKKWK